MTRVLLAITVTVASDSLAGDAKMNYHVTLLRQLLSHQDLQHHQTNQDLQHNEHHLLKKKKLEVLTLSNQTSRYKIKCIIMANYSHYNALDFVTRRLIG